MLRGLLIRELTGGCCIGEKTHNTEVLDASIIYPSIITHPPTPSRIRHEALRHYGISVRPVISLLSVIMRSVTIEFEDKKDNNGGGGGEEAIIEATERNRHIRKVLDHLHCSKTTHVSILDDMGRIVGERSFLSGGVEYALHVPEVYRGQELLLARGPKCFHICLNGSLQNTEPGTKVIAVLPITKSHAYIAIRSYQEYSSLSMQTGFIGLGDVSDAEEQEWVPEIEVDKSTTIVSRFTLRLKE
jgi:hypothetical protein